MSPWHPAILLRTFTIEHRRRRGVQWLAREGRSLMRFGHCSRGASSLAFAGAVLAGAASARAQIATLDKGHSILVNNGLQIWGLDTGASSFNYGNLANANFNGVVWSWNVDNAPHPKLTSLTAGPKGGERTDPNINPPSPLRATGRSKKSDPNGPHGWGAQASEPGKPQ